MQNEAIVDIRLRPRYAIPHTLPIIDLSNACNQASAPIVCTPLHGSVQFAIYRVVRPIGRMFFFQNCLFSWSRYPNVTHCSSSQAHLLSQTVSRSVNRFVWVPNAMLYNTLSMGRKPPKPHFPLEFRHPAEGRLSNGHRQHAQKLVKIVRAVPEISLRIDRHTHTQTYSP